MPRILYKYPSRERPDKFFDQIENIKRFSTHDDYVILCSFDEDDASMNNDEVKAKLSTIDKIVYSFGKSANKVDAINRDMDLVHKWDILIVLADDLHPDVIGFDTMIVEYFKSCFPNYDGFLHLPDGVLNERLATICCMGRKLYEWFGFIYNPAYYSVYCDQEQQDIVQSHCKYAYMRMILIRHRHPLHGRTQWDALYKRNEDPVLYQHDIEVYTNRRNNNFGITKKDLDRLYENSIQVRQPG